MRAGGGRRVGSGGTARGRAPFALALLWLLLAMACDGPGAQITLPELPPERDASFDAAVEIPEGAKLCERDDECDDGVDCTRDQCVGGRYCANTSDFTRCSDDVFCNGQEVCDPRLGCRPSAPLRCNDDDVCTIDYCDEAAKACVHEPRDFDDDGEVDWHCLGGTDCDDFDGTRASDAAELCADGIDNDCDDQIDEAACGRAEHDSCEDALDVSAGGRFWVDLAGTSLNYALTCTPEEKRGARDVAFTFTTDKPMDVTLIASGLLGDSTEETATVALRVACGDSLSEIECSYGFPGQVRIRGLPAGRYFAIANTLASSIVLEARFEDATPVPSNVSCEDPLDISAGGRFEGDFTDVGDDAVLPCVALASSDLFYSFTTEREQDVLLSATSFTDDRMNMAIGTACGDPDSVLRCLSAAPARARLHQLPPGTYYVAVEGPRSFEVDFSLDVAFLEPTPPPLGDSCQNPLDLPLETETSGRLANYQDLVAVEECGCNEAKSERGCSTFLPDMVYALEVKQATDLELRINGGSASLWFYLRSACDMGATQLSCGSGTMARARVRNVLPGTYYLVLESPDPANYTVEIERLPRSQPVVVSGNDTCGNAHVIPETGGLFAGNTSDMIPDYRAASCGGGALSKDAAYRLELSAPARVRASLEASFDAVLHVHIADGGPEASCQAPQIACDDDGGDLDRNSLIERILDPGVYYYIVDGFNSNEDGEYVLDVSVSPP